MEKFIDYYRLLEVHYDASPEVIRAAYHKLSAVYHPDGNEGADKMALLNVAYDTLSDEKKRAAYHEKWLKTYRFLPSVRDTKVPAVTPDTMVNAVASMDDFFYSLLNGYYERAYVKLTDEDKKMVSLQEFTEFRKAVDSCYEMKSYSIKFNKMLSHPLIGSVSYKRAAEISITVNEFDLIKNAGGTDVTTKYAVYDGASWRIVLNMHGIKNATRRFRLLAEKAENYDPILIYNAAAKRIDIPTGLLSESGLMEELEKEFYRCKRYARPLSLIHIFAGEEDLIRIAARVKGTLRMSDVAGVSKGKIVIILPETDAIRGLKAEKKIALAIESLGLQKGTYSIKRNDARLSASPKEALNIQ